MLLIFYQNFLRQFDLRYFLLIVCPRQKAISLMLLAKAAYPPAKNHRSVWNYFFHQGYSTVYKGGYIVLFHTLSPCYEDRRRLIPVLPSWFLQHLPCTC